MLSQVLKGNRILVRAPNWIGDAVMCTPALLSLRNVFPLARITILARPSVAEVLRGHPGLDDVIVYDHQGCHQGILGKWKLMITLRRRHFDLAILFQNAFEAAMLAFLAGVPLRYGYATDGRQFLLSESLPPFQRERRVHQVYYYQYLIDQLSGRTETHLPCLHIFEEEERALVQRLQHDGIAEHDVMIGINPGSVYGSAKRWLPEHFAAVADRLIQQLRTQVDSSKRIQCLIVGGRGEEHLGKAIAALMQNAPVVLSGKTTVRELMVVIKRCHLFLTNDTGPMHIASAFGVPLVAIFGPTDPTTTAPFGSDHALVRHPVSCSPCQLRCCPIDHRCMTSISVDDVYEASIEHIQLSADTGLKTRRERFENPCKRIE